MISTSDSAIREFRGKYRFLSNFWPSIIVLQDGLYPTVEHAYQASKFLSGAIRDVIRKSPTPGGAKSLGRKFKCRADWDSVRLYIMYSLVLQKFQRKELASRLLATRDVEIIEGNTWGDTYWGVCYGVGDNNLGNILMEVRDKIRKTRSRG